MKWISISVISILLSLTTSAQLNDVDATGKKQGPWANVYPGTRVYIYKGQFKDDKPVGKFTYFYESSKVKAIIEHDSGSSRSVGYYYHETGGLMSHGIFRNLKKDSVWVNFDKTGVLRSRESYKNDSLHGKCVVYYKPEEGTRNQMVSAISHYNNGKLDGAYQEYFVSGTIMRKGSYENGKRHGIWESYHSNGKKMTFERYKQGKRHGWCFAYDNTGKEEGKKYYYYGRLLEGKQLKKKMEELKRLGINPNE